MDGDRNVGATAVALIPVPAGKQYIDSVHLMRGIAALLVVLEHIVGRPAYALFNSVFGFLDHHGAAGVSAFFVISGIVLPLSLGADYRWNKFPKFLIRRAVRIEPTYLASVFLASAIIFLMSSLAPNGLSQLPSLKRFALHALYLIPFSNQQWIQPVYWTLAVEFQFYLIIGLLFPLIAVAARKSKVMGAGVCVSFAFLSFLSPFCRDVDLLKYSPCFALGMLVAAGRIFGFRPALLIGGGLLVQGMALWTQLPNQMILAGTVAAVIATIWSGHIRRDHPFIKPFWFLGTISYSLYVIHQVIASAGENIARLFVRIIPGTGGLILANLAPVAALAISLMAGWLLWRLVERPTMELSRRLGGKSVASIA